MVSDNNCDDLITASTSAIASAKGDMPNGKQRPGLKKIPPYWHPYRTNAKGRWFDREILEMVSTEFRDRSVEYYVCFLFNCFIAIPSKI